jgi:hypothetical protein
LVDLPFRQAEFGHAGAMNNGSGSAKVLLEPIREAALAWDLGETDLPRILVADRSQVGPIIAPHAADFVTTAATQQMKQRLTLHQAGCPRPRAQIFIDRPALGRGKSAEGGDPGTGSSLFFLRSMMFVPILLESGGTDAGQIGAFLSACSAGTQSATSSIHAMASEAIGLLETEFPLLQLRHVRNAEVSVTAAATGKRILVGQHRLRPVGHLAVGVGRVGRSSLAAVANRATVDGGIVDDV